uniref:Uncharacterized protein n=1 Tax=Glossina brevipalpis TaxID=37001 RepID=A0A1A9W4Z3_9MUSC
MSDSTLYHHYKTLMPKASLASLWLAFNIALLLQEPSKHIATVQAAYQADNRFSQLPQNSIELQIMHSQTCGHICLPVYH